MMDDDKFETKSGHSLFILRPWYKIFTKFEQLFFNLILYFNKVHSNEFILKNDTSWNQSVIFHFGGLNELTFHLTNILYAKFIHLCAWIPLFSSNSWWGPLPLQVWNLCCYHYVEILSQILLHPFRHLSLNSEVILYPYFLLTTQFNETPSHDWK